MKKAFFILIVLMIALIFLIGFISLILFIYGYRPTLPLGVEPDWDAISAITNIFGIIATLLAVCVALWQTKYPYKKKLKIDFLDNACLSRSDGSFDDCIRVKITNTGNRSVVIESVFLYDKFVGAYQICSNFDEDGNKLPYKVEPEDDGITLYQSLESYKHMLLNLVYIKNNKLLGTKIKLMVSDTTGTNFFHTSNCTYKSYEEATNEQ